MLDFDDKESKELKENDFDFFVKPLSLSLLYADTRKGNEIKGLLLVCEFSRVLMIIIIIKTIFTKF